MISLKDTSVNIAAAFHAAQTGHGLASTVSDGDTKTRNDAASKTSDRPQRARSPAEQIASTARALSPVRFFLRPAENGHSEDVGDYNSFSSMGSEMRTGDVSYDYRREEDFVRQAQAATRSFAKEPRKSDSKRRTKAEEDMPYRPSDEHYEIDSDDSHGEGEGLVKGGALEARAGSRGQRRNRGEGYLGMGLGLQQRSRTKSTAQGTIEGSDIDDAAEGSEGSSGSGSASPAMEVMRHQTPFRLDNLSESLRKSPTPAQLLRAISPRVQRPSPAPGYIPRQRQSSRLRAMITHALQGVAMLLRWIVDVAVSVCERGISQPSRSVLYMISKSLRSLQRNWWKWVLSIMVLSIALRVLRLPQSHIAWNNASEPTTVPVDEMVSRLAVVERLLSSQTASSPGASRGARLDASLEAALEHRLSVLERRSKESGQIANDDTHLKIDQLRSDLADLIRRLDHNDRLLAQYTDSGSKIAGFTEDLRALETRVEHVENGLTEVLDSERLSMALERLLPARMPIKVNPRGTIDVDPAFWTEIKKAFVSRTEVGELLKESLLGSSVASKDEGLRLNQLDAWGERFWAEKASASALLSKHDFMKLLDSELATLRNEMRSKPRSSVRQQTSSQITLKTSKGEDVTSVVQELIDAALTKYSKDTIARPDFALFTAGGRVVPSITSDTLVLRSASRANKLLFGSRDVEGRSPATALHPDNAVGECWPFKGNQGQLGVLLARRVIVTDVTVEHAAKELALDVSTAPKDIEVWAVIEGSEHQAKVADYHRSRDLGEVPSDRLLLAEIVYDPDSASPIQTTPIPAEIIDLGIDVGIVIFKVTSNWGADLTCLYRVRVHGHDR